MSQNLRADIQDCINSNLNCSFNYEHSRSYLFRVVKPISVSNEHLKCTEDGVFKVFKLDGIYEFNPMLEFGRLNNCNKLYYHHPSINKTTIFKYDSLTDLAMKMTNYFGQVYTTTDLVYFTSNHFTFVNNMRFEGLSKRGIFELLSADEYAY
jgi:predicted DNA-binding transcriptional regulator YafY